MTNDRPTDGPDERALCRKCGRRGCRTPHELYGGEMSERIPVMMAYPPGWIPDSGRQDALAVAIALGLIVALYLLVQS